MVNLRADIRGDKDEFLKKVADWSVKYGPSIGCYESPGDINPHVHVWIQTESAERAVRENFKRYFPDNIGNDGYSLSSKDGELRYIAKGVRYPEVSDAEIFVNTRFTDAEIAEAHALGWESKKKGKKKLNLKVSGTKANTDDERDTTLNAITRNAKETEGSTLWSYYDCFKFVTRWYRQNVGQMPQQHYGKSLVDGLYLNLGRESGPFVYREKSLVDREKYIYSRWYGGVTVDDQV